MKPETAIFFLAGKIEMGTVIRKTSMPFKDIKA